MTFLEKIQLIERLDSLIRRRATGSPKEEGAKFQFTTEQDGP